MVIFVRVVFLTRTVALLRKKVLLKVVTSEKISTRAVIIVIAVPTHHKAVTTLISGWSAR